jgi:hypothetical protein
MRPRQQQGTGGRPGALHGWQQRLSQRCWLQAWQQQLRLQQRSMGLRCCCRAHSQCPMMTQVLVLRAAGRGESCRQVSSI